MYVAYFEYKNREPERIEYSFQPFRKVPVEFRNFQNEIVSLNISDKATLETGVGSSNFITFMVRTNSNSDQYERYRVLTSKGIPTSFKVER